MIIFIKFLRNINLKTHLIVFTVLSFSIIIIGLIFCYLSALKDDFSIINHLFSKDLGELLSSKILESINLDDRSQIFYLLEKIYLSMANIRYVALFCDDTGLLFSLPIYYSSLNKDNIVQANSHLFFDQDSNFYFNIPLVSNEIIFQKKITNIIVPLTKNGVNIGSLKLGININSVYIESSHFIYKVSLVAFIIIWLIAISISLLNALMIIEPINELSTGIKSISLGNFNTRIMVKYSGPFRELLLCFNEMAERLEYYEKNTVNKLIIEKNKLASIVSIIGDGTILINRDLRLLFANNVAIKVFNWHNLDITGKFISHYLPSHVNQILLPVFNKLVQTNCFTNYNKRTEEVCIHLDYGQHKVFRFILTAVLDRQTLILTSIAIIIQDISHEVRLNEAKDQFVGNVSHELRTPLCNIGSFLEIILDYSCSLTEEQKKHFLIIANDETKRLSRLVDDILDLSCLESDYYSNLVDVNIVDILISISKTSQLIADKNNIELILEIDERIEYVLGHEGLIFQVVSNLVSNAIKFTHIYGKIILRAYLLSGISLYINRSVKPEKDQYLGIIRIEIIDEGIGIDKQDQKIIFDRFVRIEDDVKTLKGTGLGLSIVKKILLNHYSHIMLQSELSVGTSLSFDLIHISN
uniref:Uncharacterized sensor-like histidine kinase ycf26 n=1 Tax=Bornetia secundiflora TaxID=2575637 RepID=A0A4D6WPJ1_9FLOR|nr:Drug sensory protein A [Bornetia secundiflora]